MNELDQYMGFFLADMEEQVDALNRAVLALEKSNQDPEILNQLFRIAHTLKGSSATMGLEIISNLTHKMENILDEVRHGHLGVDLRLINTLFTCLDQLQSWHNSLTAGGENLTPATELINQLELLRQDRKRLVTDLPQLILTPKTLAHTKSYAQQGWWTGAFGVRIDPDCIMQGVRAYLAYSKAKECGEVLAVAPELPELSAGEYRGNIVLWVALPPGVEPDEVKLAIRELAEITDVVTCAWSEGVGNLIQDSGIKVVIPDEENSEQVRMSQTGTQPGEDKTSTDPVTNGIIQHQTETKGPAEAEHMINQSKVLEGKDYLRIEVGKLDALMNLLGELVIDRARLNQVTFELENSFAGETTETLADISGHISLITGELQECLLKLRMSPMSVVYGRLPRAVRDLSRQLGKDVDLVLKGEETELDRSIIQNISEPLLHLIRNSLDHGLETPADRLNDGKSPVGELIIKAEQIGGQIVITVKDDGRGINPDAIRQEAVSRGLISAQEARAAKDADVWQWIFEPGFSTRKEVSEVSGRGVGMDVVKHKVEEMQGRIHIESQPGAGTTVSITLPLTLAVLRALLVEVGGHVYTIPLVNVVETLRVARKETHQLGANQAIVVRGRTIPLINLLDWSNVSSSEDLNNSYLWVVLVSTGVRQAGLIVSRLIREQDVVVKTLDKYLGRLKGFAGATLLGDGRVSLIYDIPSLLSEVDIFLKSAG